MSLCFVCICFLEAVLLLSPTCQKEFNSTAFCGTVEQCGTGKSCSCCFELLQIIFLLLNPIYLSVLEDGSCTTVLATCSAEILYCLGSVGLWVFFPVRININ